MKEREELSIDLWLKYWDLYDSACWHDYLNRSALKRAFKKSEYNLRSYLHDNILVPAIEQIEHNLDNIDGNSKFLYWFRFREELSLIGKEYHFDKKTDLEEQAQAKYNEYMSHLDGVREEYRPRYRPDYDYFKWFYIALCSLKSDADIFFNEILFNLPIFNDTEVNRRNLELLEQERKERIVNIYNYGIIDTIINNLEKVADSTSRGVSSNLSNNQIVELIVENFKRQIENNGLFRLLYEGKPKKLRHESTAQQLFFSVAQIFCLANDLDVSPETNSGLGSVDFKFSKGAIGKINVEIKYSSHKRLKHGLETQLRKYDLAEQTNSSYFLIVQVDSKDRLLQEIQELDRKLHPHKSKVKVVDGRLKNSASLK